MKPKERRERREGKKAARDLKQQYRDAMSAKREAFCKGIAGRLRDAGWSNVTVKVNGGIVAIGGTDPHGRQRSGCQTPPMMGAVIVELIEQGKEPAGAATTPAPRPAAPPAPIGRQIEIDGKAFTIVDADIKRITGALFRVLNRKDSEVVLESGEILPVTRKNSNAIAAALAAM